MVLSLIIHGHINKFHQTGVADLRKAAGQGCGTLGKGYSREFCVRGGVFL